METVAHSALPNKALNIFSVHLFLERVVVGIQKYPPDLLNIKKLLHLTRPYD